MTEAVGRIGTLPRAEPARWRFDARWILIGVPVALVVWLAIVPLGFLLWQSILTPHTASKPSEYTLDNFRTAYFSAETFQLFMNSVVFAAGTAVFALVLGTALAWMNERTNTPFKRLFFALALIPLVIPGILFTVSWMLLASPKIGLLNVALQGLLGTDTVFFNIYTMAGMIWVDGLHYSPIAFLLMTAAFRSMDPALEESAQMSGASIPQVAYRVTFKLAWPAALGALLILFVRAIESFEVPALIGLPANIHVYTSAIYQAIHQYPSRIGLASAYAITLLVLCCFGIYLQSRLAYQSGRFSTVTGKGFRPRTIDLGAWRWVAAAGFVVYFIVIVLLPFLILLWASTQRYYAAPTWETLGRMSLDNYRLVLDFPNFWPTVRHSLILSLTCAAVVMLLSAVIAWVVVRTRVRGRWLLDSLASMPLVFPGIVLGLAILVCYLFIDAYTGSRIYGTNWTLVPQFYFNGWLSVPLITIAPILLIAYVTRFLPYGVRYVSTSMMQIHKELEESAAMSGATWSMNFRRIVLPLLKPGLLAGFVYVMIVSIRELSSSILLYSPGGEVISIMIWELWQNGQYPELAALGVMLILLLFALVMVAQLVGKRFGIAEK